MAVSQDELGQRLKRAREACGLTQEQVAEAIGVPRPSVVQIELGRRSVSSIELDKLAHLFGRDMAEFLRGDFNENDPLVALFRGQPDAAQPAVVEALRRCLALGREVTNLERLLEIERVGTTALYPQNAPRSKWEAIQQGLRVADEERRRLGLGWTPLADLAELLEEQGVRTALVDLPEDVSGLTISHHSVGLFVVANRRHHVWRRRFSYAHEYAHVLLDRDRLSTVSRASDRDELIEVRANSFAAIFLMPEEGVRDLLAGLGKGRPSRGFMEVFDEEAALGAEGRNAPGSQEVQIYDLVQLAHHFGVSRLSALYRLKNLRLATQPQFDRLKQEDDEGKGAEVARLLDLPEPDHESARNEFRHRFLGLGLEALRRERISRAKLNELAAQVEVTPEEIDQLVGLAGASEPR